MTGPWPDEALAGQAGSIGPALLQLIDSETRWVHRRVERIELLNATQLTRSVSTDFTVPPSLENLLGLQQQESDRATKQATRYVVPLGILPKGPLQDITITPSDVYRLTADQTNPIVIGALTPYARQAGGSPREVLTLAREIVRSETVDAEPSTASKASSRMLTATALLANACAAWSRHSMRHTSCSSR